MVVWFSVVILLIIIISGHFGNIPILGLFRALSLKKNGLQYGQVGYLLNEGQKCSNLELKDNQFDELLLFSKYDFWPENGKFFFIKGDYWCIYTM